MEKNEWINPDGSRFQLIRISGVLLDFHFLPFESCFINTVNQWNKNDAILRANCIKLCEGKIYPILWVVSTKPRKFWSCNNLRYQTKNHVLTLQITLHTLRNSYTVYTTVILNKISKYLQSTTITNTSHSNLL